MATGHDTVSVRRHQQVDQPHIFVKDTLTETGIPVAAQRIGQRCVTVRFVVLEEVEPVGVAAEESASGPTSAFAVVDGLLLLLATVGWRHAGIRFRLGDGAPQEPQPADSNRPISQRL